MLIVGWIFAMLSGMLMPSLALFIGQLTGNYKEGASDPDTKMLELLKILLIVAGIVWLFGGLYYAFF